MRARRDEGPAITGARPPRRRDIAVAGGQRGRGRGGSARGRCWTVRGMSPISPSTVSRRADSISMPPRSSAKSPPGQPFWWLPTRWAPANGCCDLTVEYSKQRQQFGRPIGSFQAVKHAAAQMLVTVEASMSVAFFAAQSAEEGLPERAPARRRGEGAGDRRRAPSSPTARSPCTARSATRGSTICSCSTSGPSSTACCSAHRQRGTSASPTPCRCCPDAGHRLTRHRAPRKRGL